MAAEMTTFIILCRNKADESEGLRIEWRRPTRLGEPTRKELKAFLAQYNALTGSDVRTNECFLKKKN
jgi:hypothetical protein